MAVTQNTYTGNGSTVLFSFTFPYLETTDIKVSLNGTLTTAYTLANATTIQFNTAPANGAAIRIYRVTDDAALAAQFYPGSAIRSQDLNDNFTQNLYVTQESNRDATSAIATANSALTASASATSTSNTALSQSSTALSNSTAAVSTANTASANATTALSQSATAVTTANSSQATATSAAADAASALSTSATASSNASTALSQSNTALSNSSTALSQSTTALSNSASAVTTAGTASTNASTALSTANSAITTANNAAAAVANAQIFTIVAAVANIPGSPANNAAVEVTNSTGIESFTPLAGVPGGFTGNSGLSVRITYSTSGSTWNWVQYFPNDPESRYLKTGTGTVTSTNIADGTIVNADVNASAAIAGTKISPDFGSQNVTTTGTATAAALIPSGSSVPTNGVYLPSANNVAISTNGTGRLFVDASGNVGVGVSAPQGTLSVEGEGRVVTIGDSGTANRPVIKSRNSDNTGYAYLHYDAFEHRFYDSGVLSYANGQNQHIFSTSNSERLRITSDGKLGLGTSGPETVLHINTSTNPTAAGSTGFEKGAVLITAVGATAGTNNLGAAIAFSRINTTRRGAMIAAVESGADPDQQGLAFFTRSETITSSEAVVERLRIDELGRVGIGTTSPGYRLDVQGTGTTTIDVGTNDTSGNAVGEFRAFYLGGGGGTGSAVWLRAGSGYTYVASESNSPLLLGTNSTERARIDTSGRLLVGTSSAPSGPDGISPKIASASAAGSTAAADIQIASYQAAGGSARTKVSGKLFLGHSRSGTSGTLGGAVVDGDNLGEVRFWGDDGTNAITAAEIVAQVDGTPGANDMPGRLVFSTTADGSASPTERMRLDSSGRLLVGASTSVNTTALGNAQVQVVGTSNETAQLAISRFSNDADRGRLTFIKSRGASGTNAVVQADDAIGRIEFLAADGGSSTAYPGAANIGVFVDGTPGLNDMPGRLVLSVTADGASSPTEALRITNDRVVAYNQPDVTSKSAAATLTVAELKTKIIQYTGAAATLTLPTGTLTEGGFSGIYTNMTFEWSVINTGSGTCTIGAGTGHTIVGGATIAAGASGRFASRRTAANTFVTYRLS